AGGAVSGPKPSRSTPAGSATTTSTSRGPRSSTASSRAGPQSVPCAIRRVPSAPKRSTRPAWAPVPRQAGAASTGTSSTEPSGSDDSRSAKPAMAASASPPPPNRADGRQVGSSEGYVALDKSQGLRVVGRGASKEPARQRVDLTGKQSYERGAL